MGKGTQCRETEEEAKNETFNALFNNNLYFNRFNGVYWTSIPNQRR